MKPTTQRLGAAATSAVSLVDDGGGRKPADFPELSLITLTSEEIKSGNTWNLWCGGNVQFWDRVAR